MLGLLPGEMKSLVVIYRIGKLEYDPLSGGAKPKLRKPAYLDEGDDDTDDEDYEPKSDYSCDSNDERVQKLANHSMSGSCWGTLKKIEFVRHANHDGCDVWPLNLTMLPVKNFMKGVVWMMRAFMKKLHALVDRRAIRFQKNAKVEVRVFCVPGCNWEVYGVKLPDVDTFEKLLKIAKSSYVEEHDELMAALKEFDEGAWAWLQNEDVVHWCRSHFPTATRCDCDTNNVFNTPGAPPATQPSGYSSPEDGYMHEGCDFCRSNDYGEDNCPRLDIHCDYCNYFGHYRNECYELERDLDAGVDVNAHAANAVAEEQSPLKNPSKTGVPIHEQEMLQESQPAATENPLETGAPVHQPESQPLATENPPETGVPVHQPESQQPVYSIVDEDSIHETEPKHTGNAGQEVDDEVTLDIHFEEEIVYRVGKVAAPLKDPRSGIIRPKVSAPAHKKRTRICTSSAPTTPRRASARLMNLALAKKMDVDGPGSTSENDIQILTEEEASTFLRKKPKTFHGVDPHQG
ncbi:OLC1v1036329C1 [Oldenlandia corymbosa var. corymbosa]|uniref:OLC1v1036329C1 n=1 Tax=Oldenlandia corymbosa var. corymbosa TaxID=529605 RepID=A0AAV1CVW3_OLDCO|nr:OLC1v1036329C1 [Oldenlandia corymbosa var. corymbosa]